MDPPPRAVWERPARTALAVAPFAGQSRFLAPCAMSARDLAYGLGFERVGAWLWVGSVVVGT